MKRIAPSTLLVLALASCAGGPPPTMYRLENDAAAAPAHSDAAPEVITVASVSVPERVDRIQIVAEDGDRRDYASSAHRWSSPLGDQVERMLVRRLQAARPQAWVGTDRGGPAPASTMRAQLIIDELGARLGGEVVVSGRWEVRRMRPKDQAGRNAGPDPVRLGTVTVHASAHGDGYDALAAAIGAAVGQVCDAVVADIERLPHD